LVLDKHETPEIKGLRDRNRLGTMDLPAYLNMLEENFSETSGDLCHPFLSIGAQMEETTLELVLDTIPDCHLSGLDNIISAITHTSRLMSFFGVWKYSIWSRWV
jgi:hypothetical protein